MGSHLRTRKENLMREIRELDARADTMGLSNEEWARRYAAEDEMVFILTCEDMY